MSYSDKTKEVQKQINTRFKWGKDTFGDNHVNPILGLKLKEEVDELVVELRRKAALTDPDAAKDYLENVFGADEYIQDQLQKLDKKIEEEAADVFIMLMHVITDHGITFEELIKLVNSKFHINKLRKWNKPGANGTINHKTK